MFSIFNTAGTPPAGEAFPSGSMPGEGTYFCLVCGTQLSLRETDELPGCTYCGATRFRRDSIFSSLQDHGSPTVEFALPVKHEPPAWLDEAREALTGSGYHLAMRERGEVLTFHLGAGWVRIGRCDTAGICIDDPSVSRRHAMLAIDDDRARHVSSTTAASTGSSSTVARSTTPSWSRATS